MKRSCTRSPAAPGRSHTAAPFPWLCDFYLLSLKRSQKPMSASDSPGSHAPRALSVRGRAARSCWGVKSQPPCSQEGVWAPCSPAPPMSCPGPGEAQRVPRGLQRQQGWSWRCPARSLHPVLGLGNTGLGPRGAAQGLPGPPHNSGQISGSARAAQPQRIAQGNPRGVRACLKYFIATSYGPLILPAAGLLRVNTKPLYS